MKILKTKCVCLIWLLLLSVNTLTVMAQSDPTGKSVVTRTYALTKATVIPSPGQEITEATVLIKDGLIVSVGKNVSLPADAEVIDATGLYIYAGFIDGMSNTGAKRPKAPERPSNLFTPDPPNDYAGITPENSVVSQLDISSSSIAGMRKVGFTISHTVPYGRMLPGSGSLLLLTEVDHIDELILAKDVAMYTQFTGAPGAYPNNILGIMAKWRNLYRNAVNDKAHADMYAENPAGLPRPDADRVSRAFFPVLTKERPVFFDVDEMLDVRRAMRLQKDLGFTLVVAGVKQGWDLMNDLKSTNTPVFMSLDLPDEPKEIKVDEKTAEVEAQEKRRMEFYKKYVEQAGQYEKAGIAFGFSTKGSRGNKIKGNIITMIENGLSEEAALAALTTNPASIIGISQIAGTVEAGKLANLIVSTAPYFTKDSQIKMMFVDGDKYEYEIKEKKAKKDKEEATEAPATASTGNDPIIGSWSFSFITPQGEQTGKMIIKKNDSGAYEGVLTSDDGSPDNDMNNVSFQNGELAFDFSIDAGGQAIEIVVVGTVTGKNYDAEASIAAFNVSFELTATKDE